MARGAKAYLNARILPDFKYVKKVVFRQFQPCPDIRFTLDSDLRKNAYACPKSSDVENDGYIIGIGVGFVDVLKEFSRVRGNILYKHYDGIFEINKEQFSSKFQSMMLKYLFYHEFSHITRGHLDSIYPLLGIKPEGQLVHFHEALLGVKEANLIEGHIWSNDVVKENAYRRLRFYLECDADIAAGRFLAWELPRQFVHPEVFKVKAMNELNSYGFISFIACSVQTLFWFIHSLTEGTSQPTNLERMYPVPLVRSCILLTGLFDQLLSSFEEPIWQKVMDKLKEDGLRAALEHGMATANNVETKVSNRSISSQEIADAVHSWSKDCLPKVNQLQEKLWPYTFDYRYSKSL